MQVHDQVQGFEVLRSRPLPELEARLWEMEHRESGARLVWLERDQDNRTFEIAFRTVPEDDTGVFHILEHSVLNGSERFPLKEPFVDLLKGSMQTFLNAFTYPDKTVYPVSSRNPKDFLQLMEVYLDAVFAPLLRPEVFRQEGWHWEPGEGTALRSGVVLNEMKGALSDPQSRMIDGINRGLFPDTPYRFESGGEPSVIPQLTWEKFCETHRRFYHPSNSWIFLDGHMDLPEVLGLLNCYLSGKGKIDPGTQLPLQRPVHPEPLQVAYPLAPGTDPEGKTWVALAYVLGDFTQREERIAMNILTDVLGGSNDSPLKAAVLQAGLAEEVFLWIMDGIVQPYLVVEVRNLKEERIGELTALIREQLDRLCREGLDRQQVEAALASAEFEMRERDFGRIPQGIGLGVTALEGWLFGGDPMDSLETDRLFASLREHIREEGWLEALLRRLTLDNPHCCQVNLIPSLTLEEENRRQEEEQIRQAMAQWTPEEEARLRREQEELAAWQAAPDSPEAKASLPRLHISDVNPEPEDIPTEIRSLNGVPCLVHRIPYGGIAALSFSFDITDLSQEELSLAAFLSALYGNLATEMRDASEVKRLCRLYLNGLSTIVEPFGARNDPGRCRTFLTLSFRTLESSLEEAVGFAAELLTSTLLTDPAKILDLLRQERLQAEQMVVENGHSYAVARVMAGASCEGVVRECSSGITFCRWMKDMEKDYDRRAEDLLERLRTLAGKIITCGRLTVRVTGLPADRWEDILRRQLLERLPGGERRELSCPLQPWSPRREGIRVAADVSYSAVGGTLAPQSGKTVVLGHILSLDYLWNTVRVQGGAYGTGVSLAETGGCALYSYRDPNASRSLEVFRGLREYLEQFCREDPDLTSMLIGTVSESEPVLAPFRLGALADGRWFRGITRQDLIAQRREMLETTPEDLLRALPAMEAALAGGSTCVIGGEKHLKQCESLLDRVEPI